MGRYVNPYTDYGFKRIFGNPELLMMFLNALFEREGKVITDVKYLDKEKIPEADNDRTIIYDVYCTVNEGEDFILEMQQKRQDTFLNRSLFYASRAIVEQGIKGRDWRYKLQPVYGIYFMDFHLDDKVTDHIITDTQLMDADRHELVCDKLRMIFIDLQAFNKEANECENNLDCWIYIIKNLGEMKTATITKNGFDRLYFWAEVAAMPKRERIIYEESLKRYRDEQSFRETEQNARLRAREEGRKEGRKEGIAEGRTEGERQKTLEIAKSMKADGLPFEVIVKYTGLSKSEIEGV